MRKVIAALALVALAACGSDSTTDPLTGSIGGTYTLQTVNGNNIPYTFTTQNGVTETVTSDVITVNDANGTWSEQYNYRDVSSTGQTSTGTLNDGGTYSRSGANVSLYSTGDQTPSFVGTFDGRRFTFFQGNVTLVYSR